jgi:hypothetical protein
MSIATYGLGLGAGGGPTSVAVQITGGEILEQLEGEIQKSMLEAVLIETTLEGTITEPLEGELD